MFDALRFIWREEGLVGLYKGMGTQMFKAVVASALMLMFKEKIQQLFATAVATASVTVCVLRLQHRNWLSVPERCPP